MHPRASSGSAAGDGLSARRRVRPQHRAARRNRHRRAARACHPRPRRAPRVLHQGEHRGRPRDLARPSSSAWPRAPARAPTAGPPASSSSPTAPCSRRDRRHARRPAGRSCCARCRSKRSRRWVVTGSTRVIAAPAAFAAAGVRTLPEDLYYRLNVLPIRLPPCARTSATSRCSPEELDDIARAAACRIAAWRDAFAILRAHPGAAAPACSRR